MVTKTTYEIKKMWCAVDSVECHERFNNTRWVKVNDEIGFNELLLREISMYEPTQLTLSLVDIIVKHINELSQSNLNVSAVEKSVNSPLGNDKLSNPDKTSGINQARDKISSDSATLSISGNDTLSKRTGMSELTIKLVEEYKKRFDKFK